MRGEIDDGTGSGAVGIADDDLGVRSERSWSVRVVKRRAGLAADRRPGKLVGRLVPLVRERRTVSGRIENEWPIVGEVRIGGLKSDDRQRMSCVVMVKRLSGREGITVNGDVIYRADELVRVIENHVWLARADGNRPGGGQDAVGSETGSGSIGDAVHVKDQIAGGKIEGADDVMPGAAVRVGNVEWTDFVGGPDRGIGVAAISGSGGAADEETEFMRCAARAAIEGELLAAAAIALGNQPGIRNLTAGVSVEDPGFDGESHGRIARRREINA